MGFFDGDPSTWITEGIRARRFDDEDVAQQTAYYLRQRFPQVASYIHVVAGEALAPRSPCALKGAKPPGGKFSKPEDLRGMVLAGSPEDVVRDIRLYETAGAELIIFDLRFRFGEWFQQIEWLGREVLPAFG